MTKKKSEMWEWIKALLIAVGLAVVIRYFLIAPIVVDGESMMPTLHDRDKMIVNKFGYVVGEPERFDIIVFHAPEEKDYIKRIEDWLNNYPRAMFDYKSSNMILLGI